VALMLALPALSGCLWHTRRVPKAKMPVNVLTATPQQLVQIIDQQYDAVDSMFAAVTFTATEGGSLKGSEKTITPFSGYIFIRKPESLRVIGYLPVVHSPAFDMASDGKMFQLWIPPKNEAFEGTNTVTEESANAFENMRPYMFFDSLLIPKVGPNDLLTVTGDSNTVVDPKTKKLEIEPEYLLTVESRQDNSSLLLVHRVIHFSRINLRPSEEDIYDQNGQIQTQALYGPLQRYGTELFPGTVTLRWPLQQQQILITIEKLKVNQPVNNDTFEVKIPKSAKVRVLH
jgi:outer membrane lipoprotein-sorting protein